MDIVSTGRGRMAVLSASGRLNMVAAPQLKKAVDEAVAGGHPRIVVDLSAVDFIDSSGLGALIGGLKSARQASGDLRISGAGEQVRTVLGLTNLDRILKPYADIEEASHGW
ncbi:STAS domain-containing protein [Nocardioides sp. KR10-350]|uniref:STAS domain-containing protein n=1 Tax=Nocardioides cheoyonin TaxID=3156615 RepID=UPI0032B5B6EA